MWYIGQKIVCVNDTLNDEIYARFKRPIQGVVYTIRGIADYIDGELGFLLEEIINEKAIWKQGYLEVTFRESRFRPLVTKPTDISIFTDMLKTEELENA